MYIFIYLFIYLYICLPHTGIWWLHRQFALKIGLPLPYVSPKKANFLFVEILFCRRVLWKTIFRLVYKGNIIKIDRFRVFSSLTHQRVRFTRPIWLQLCEPQPESWISHQNRQKMLKTWFLLRFWWFSAPLKIDFFRHFWCSTGQKASLERPIWLFKGKLGQETRISDQKMLKRAKNRF